MKLKYISEEKGKINGDDNETIVIDPIDGTTNFIHGIPIFGIVIAKIQNNEITDGIIFNPITNEFYWASKGKGAWCNNNRLRVSKRDNLNECVLGVGKPCSKEIEELNKICAGIRRLGAASIDLAYVASGKLDAHFEKNLNLWDVSSGVLLIREAGGQVSEPTGNLWDIESRDILASNTLIHDKIKKNLKF